MNSKIFFRKLLLIFFTQFIIYSISLAQTNSNLKGTIGKQNILLSGFSEDERIKLLLLNLLPSGLTEIAANEIAKVLQLNIFNTNHFSVLGPSEWNAGIKNQNPTLADCHDIACGTMIGKLFGSDKVLVGSIHSEVMLNENSEEELNFILSVRMVDTQTNITNFSDEVQFNDLQMHDELFRLAARISENTILLGKIQKIKQSGISIDIGRAQGIKTGHQLVISRSELIKDLSNKNHVSKKNIALAEVIQVNDLSAEAVIVQKISPVSKGDSVQTYIDKEKLIGLISKTRKELDTQKRLKPKKNILYLDKSIGVKSSNYEKWSKIYKKSKILHDRWLYITAGAGSATLLFISGTIKTSGILEILPWMAGAGTIYSGFRYFQYRQELDEISVEGRSLGFISRSIFPHNEGFNFNLVSNGFKINWLKKF